MIVFDTILSISQSVDFLIPYFEQKRRRMLLSLNPVLPGYISMKISDICLWVFSFRTRSLTALISTVDSAKAMNYASNTFSITAWDKVTHKNKLNHFLGIWLFEYPKLYLQMRDLNSYFWVSLIKKLKLWMNIKWS